MKSHISLFCLFLFVSFLGQAQNPIMIKDIAQNPEEWVSSFPHKFAEAGGKIFFIASAGTHDSYEMWRTDGTNAGTEKVDLNTNSQGCVYSHCYSLPVSLRDKAYWLSSHSSTIKLWEAATTGNAREIENFSDYRFNDLVVFQDHLIFPINGKLWKSNGNPNEAEVIFDRGNDIIDALTIIGNRLYFTRKIEHPMSNLLDEVEIWSTDGTAAGTMLYKKVVGDAPTECGEYDVEILNFDGRVGYSLSPNNYCDQVSWLFVEGFDPIMEAHAPLKGMGIFNPTLKDDKIFYLSFKPTSTVATGIEYYFKVFESGTSRIIKSFPSYVSTLKLLPSGKMIFRTSEGLWVTDGTANGTVLLDAIEWGTLLLHFIPYQDGYIFTHYDSDKSSFWKTDGTNNGTTKIADFPVPSSRLFRNSTQFYQKLLIDNTLYFSANDWQNGAELWRLNLDAPATVFPPPPNNPELSIWRVQNPDFITNNEPTDISFLIENNGDVPVNDDFSVGIYVSKDLNFSTDDILVGEVTMNGLAKGAEENITTPITLPANLGHLKFYRLLVYVDDGRQIPEKNETNNVKYSNVTTFDSNVNLPDLEPDVRMMPTFGKVGDSFYPDLRIQNIGLGDVQYSTTGFYISKDNSLSADDLLLDEFQSGSLAAGETSNRSPLIFTIPNLPVGDYFLISSADHLNFVVESDETNNVVANPFEIRSPPPSIDLQVELADIQPHASGDLIAQYLIFNFGNEPAPFFKIGAYLSTDDSFSSDDIFLKEGFSSDPLWPGDFLDDQIQFKIPQNFAAGDYHILIYTDDNEQVPESDETNNVFAIPYTVMPTPKVDLELSFEPLPQNNPPRWSVFSTELTVKNTGSDLATGIEISVPRPQEVIYSGGNEFSATAGVFTPYTDEVWKIKELPAGATATLEVNYFRLRSNDFTIFTQVENADQTDTDSTPGNGTCCNPREDDEAALEINLTLRKGKRIVQNSPNVFEFEVYPNPIGDKFIVDLISKNGKQTQLEIWDALGKKVFYKKIDLSEGSNQISIEFKDLPPGVFFLKIDDFTIKKLIKE